MEYIVTVRELVQSLEEDTAKFEKGNQSAGVRARKTLMSLSKVCKEGRAEISEKKNS